MFDKVIRNGTIVDGTGRERFVGDIGIRGDRIAAVGQGLGPGAEEIDATGLLVTPGWVDMHTHYDGQVTWDPYLTPSGWHGVTTVVMGNCGVGFAPVRPEDREWLIQVMEGVEDIPGSALTEGIEWDWETFPEYLDALDKGPHALDFATQIPHSALRGYVMGERGSENDEASPEEIAEMKRLVAEALEAGALGFSTSRTPLHKTARGVEVAGTHASREELFGIAEALKETGLGRFQLANDHVAMRGDVSWLEELASEIQRPVCFNLTQVDQDPSLWRDLLSAVEGAQARGVPLFGQVAGRAIGIVMNWRTTAHPFALLPTWLALFQEGLDWPELRKRLQDPEVKHRLMTEDPLPIGEFELFVTTSFDKMFVLSGGNYEPDPSESLAARADREGRSPRELAYEALMADGGAGMLYFPLFNYSDQSLEPLRELHDSDATLMGLSDGGAHCGAICDSGMPTFMLTHWTRDRARGERLALERIVKRQTRDTAAFYGLEDRGVIAEGMIADVNLIDYEALHLRDPELVYDLPAGGRRLVQRAEGYRMTLKSGVPILVDGEPTGEMPGRLLRGPQRA